MTMYTGLARVAKKTGYPVVERPGWKTRGHGQMGSIKSIICHHTASADNGNAPALGYIESNRGALPGPLAHYVLGRDGTIYVVAAGLCWHAGKVGNANHGNRHAIGIEAENNGRGEKWGPAQYDAYVKLCAALVAEFGLPTSAVLGHKEIAIPRGRKIDPTFDMGAFRAYVAKGQYLGGAAKPTDPKPAGTVKPKPTTPKGAWTRKPDGRLISKAPKTYGELYVDGDFEAVSVGALQILLYGAGYRHNELWDGDLGKLGWMDVQEWLAATGFLDTKKWLIDGKPEIETIKALQTMLAERGFLDTKKWLIDGKFQAETKKAFQRYLNARN